eukprot:1431854-Heterocapsa_arctica.AAC.1
MHVQYHLTLWFVAHPLAWSRLAQLLRYILIFVMISAEVSSWRPSAIGELKLSCRLFCDDCAFAMRGLL